MKCGCRFAGGQRVAYSDLRAHLDHIKAAIEDAAAQCLMLELVQDRAPSSLNALEKFEEEQKWRGPLQEVRTKLLDALGDWDEKARPALDKKFPENKLAEALGL